MDHNEARDIKLISSSSWNKSSVKTWGKWTLSLLKKFIEPKGLYLLIWNAIFILTSVVGISVDPLMLYIPIIHKHKKCLGVDRTLMILALLSRSFTDLFYVIDIIFQIRALLKENIERTESTGKPQFSDIIVDILAIIPLPQVPNIITICDKHFIVTICMIIYIYSG